MKKLIAFGMLLASLSVWGSQTPAQMLSNAAPWQALSARDLAVVNAYLVGKLASVTSPSNAMVSASPWQALSDRDLQIINTYLLGQIQTMGKSAGSLAWGATNTVDFQTQASANQGATNHYAIVVGGESNTAGGTYSVVVGGKKNSALGSYGFIGNGSDNGSAIAAVSVSGTIVNGQDCSILDGDFNFIGGGTDSTINSGDYNFIGTAFGSNIEGNHAFLGTGRNCFLGYIGDDVAYSSIINGLDNQAYNKYNTVLGGTNNQVSGDFSAILGGRNNGLGGTNSFILGSNITLTNHNMTAVEDLRAYGSVTVASNAQFAVTAPYIGLWNSNGLSLWVITATKTNYLGGTAP